jgi:hypothetical protein
MMTCLVQQNLKIFLTSALQVQMMKNVVNSSDHPKDLLTCLPMSQTSVQRCCSSA